MSPNPQRALNYRRSRAAYPPEPWYLGGTLLVSVFLVPARSLPGNFGDTLPPGYWMVRIAGRVIVGTAFVCYLPGGAMEYTELLVVTPALHRARLRFTIPQIWVDSPASRTGARELWGIPKHLAEFDRIEAHDTTSMAMRSHGSDSAHIASTYGRTLPGMHQFALPVAQRLAGRDFLSHNRIIGAITRLTTRWTFDADGPLGYLAGRKPLVSFALRNSSVIFGMRVRRS
ncbi:acetoacetate decarboxylase family protein [Glaciihabitans sp. dw_435]|uniref:acetoacetate decarboxylase family protein n=1 Tax=Glaciihabitans sp. dw_435 TaxID=2720081 RepID=UPI001BD6B0ED|nr:acetoacetate decarboxylase family protein [Glaciihabitans sp. dw_435]